MKKRVSCKDRVVFSEFYHQLEDKDNIFFLYCTTNLLHYVLGSIEFHKNIVNMVLITGGLSAEEKKFASKHLNIAICHLERAYIDFYIWDLLIETSEKNFGWLDIDCFIKDEKIIKDLCDIAPETCLQGVWERKYDFYQYQGILTSTYLVFVNVEIARKIWKELPQISMIPIAFTDDEKGIAFEEYRKLEEDEIVELKKFYPQESENYVGLDTTHYYQMCAASKGYPIKLIRELKNNDYSDEIVHLGSCHIMDKIVIGINRRRFFEKFKLRYSFYLLDSYCDFLPEQYKTLWERYHENLVRNGIKANIDDIKTKIENFVQSNGISLPMRA